MRTKGAVNRLLAVAFALALLATSPSFGTTNSCGWYQEFGNAANTASVRSECAPTSHRLKKLWETSLRLPARQLLEGNGKIYICDDEAITCLASTNGKVLWSMPIVKAEMIGIWNDRVCVNASGMMIGLDASTGKKKWEKRGKLISVVDGQIFHTNGDIPGELACGSMGDGAQFWVYKIFREKYQSEIQKLAISGKNCLILSRDWTDPAIDGRTLNYESSLHLLDAETGKLVWKKSIGADNYAYLGIQGNTVVINLKDIGLTLLELSSGKILWFSSIAPDMTNSVVSMDGIKIVSQLDKIVCLAAQNGKRLWTRDISTGSSSLPILTGERIWLCEKKQSVLTCLSSRDGKTLWSWGPKIQDKSMVAIGDGKISAVWNDWKTLSTLVAANSKIVMTLGSEDCKLDNQSIKTKAVPILFNNLPYVSASLVLGNLGGWFSYNAPKKELTVVFNRKTVVLTASKSTILVDGTERELDRDPKTTPQLVGGFFMIPAKTMHEVFGIKTYANIKNKMIAFNASDL